MENRSAWIRQPGTIKGTSVALGGSLKCGLCRVAGAAAAGSSGAAPQPAARFWGQREGGEPGTPAGTTRPARAEARLLRRTAAVAPAGLHFPARPAAPPQRPGREGKMAAPVSPLVTARCLLRASARRAARLLPARAAVLQRGQYRGGRGLAGPCAKPCPQPDQGRASARLLEHPVGRCSVGRPREPVRPSPPHRGSPRCRRGGGAGPRGGGLPGRRGRQPPGRAPGPPRWRAPSVSPCPPARAGRGGPADHPAPEGPRVPGRRGRELAPGVGRGPLERRGIRERPRDFPS